MQILITIWLLPIIIRNSSISFNSNDVLIYITGLLAITLPILCFNNGSIGFNMHIISMFLSVINGILLFLYKYLAAKAEIPSILSIVKLIGTIALMLKSLYYFLLIILLLIILLISNAVTLRRDKSILFSRVVMKILFFTSIIAINNLYIKPLETGISLYGGLFNVNSFTLGFNIFIFIISAIILILTAFFPRKVYIEQFSSLSKLLNHRLSYNKELISNKTGEQFRIIEYALIIVFIISGTVFLISSVDLISIFLSIELQSYGLYILSTLYRDSESATAGGLTYFLLGGLSSCFILLGSAILYANSGTTDLFNIYIFYSDTGYNTFDPLFMDLGLIIMGVGFLFKVSAAPFHSWSPDVYDGIPTIVTTYVAIIPKISIFALFAELSTHMDDFEDSWKYIFFFSCLLSLIVGSVLGLTQSRIKRLFAYSTISHVGFILLALYVNTLDSIRAFIFYILQYTITNLNAFFILLSIGFYLYLYIYDTTEDKKQYNVSENLIDKNNSPVQLISQIKGYFYINPFIAMSFAITLFSFIGVPPIAGFFAKQMILTAALQKWFSLFLVFVAIITSVIGAAYYLNLVKQMFFFKHDYKKNPSFKDIIITGYIKDSSKETLINFRPEHITINSAISSSISIITLLLILFIYIPGEWFNIVAILAINFF